MLLRLRVVEIEDELDIGYKTLLELDWLTDSGVGETLEAPGRVAVSSIVLSLGLVDSPGTADDERLVDPDESVDLEKSVDPEELVGSRGLLEAEELVDAKELFDADDLLDAEELLDAEGLAIAEELLNAEELVSVALDDNVGLKTTMAKVLPSAFLRLRALN